MKLQADPLILQALQEDITGEDVTTNAILPEDSRGQAELLAKADGIIAGDIGAVATGKSYGIL